MHTLKSEKTRVYVYFVYNPEWSFWPFLGFDRTLRKDYILETLKNEIKEIEFIGGDLVDDLSELGKIPGDANIDGILVYTLNQTLHPKMPWAFRQKKEASIFRKYPVIIASGLFAGSHPILDLNEVINREKLPVLPILSFAFEDGLKYVKSALNLIKVIRNAKRSKILYVGPMERVPSPPPANFWRIDPDQYLTTLKDVFGIEFIHMSSEEMNKLYEAVDDKSAKSIAKRWIDGAIRVDGPNDEEILKSARLYLAIKKAMGDTGANAVSVNDRFVLNWLEWTHTVTEEAIKVAAEAKFTAGALKILPCMPNSQLMDEEGISVGPEGDLDAAVTNLLMRDLTGRPGWVYEPDLSPSTGQLIYFHCCIPRKLWGTDGPSQPYELRYSCNRCGVAPQIQVPLNETVTSVKVAVKDKKLAIHQGRIIGSIRKEDRCPGHKMTTGKVSIGEQCDINKLIVETNAEKIFKNYNYGTFGWHRCAFMGDFRKETLNLAVLLGLEVVEEDRD